MPVSRRMSGLAATLSLALVTGTLATVASPASAADVLTIAAIQGTGSASPKVGEPVTTTPSVVTAVYGQGAHEFDGFVIQTPGTGGRKDLNTPSDAIFVYMADRAFDVAIGDQVTVSGTVKEYGGLTELTSPTVTPAPGAHRPVTPVTGLPWAATAVQRENLESMLYSSRQAFTVADPYPLLTSGELVLSAGALPVQPTDVGAPGSAAAAAQQVRNARTRVNLDDGSDQGYTYTPTRTARRLPFLTASTSVKVGDSLRLDEPVIVDYRDSQWTFNPTRVVTAGDEVATIRPARADKTPRVRGSFSVASFNVLNYFTTTGKGRAGCTGGDPDTTGDFNVTFDCDVRGAWDTDDLTRQQDKITSAINKLNASVVGLMEIENSAKLGEKADEATRTLVAALNTAAGERRWAYVPSSSQLQDVADQDVITNALIYQPAKVRLNGKAYALGSAAGAKGAFSNARTPIAAAFTARAGGQRMLVVVNHLKSKSGTGTGDNKSGADGQGAFNGDRVRQAKALLAWLPDLQTAARTDATALIGDFNSYTQEDPLRVLYAGGFRNAASAGQYSYVFGGLSGSLDHILLNRVAQRRLTTADVWNINSGQSQALEYSTYKTTPINYYRSNPQRSSDHDPVIAGFRKGAKSSEVDLTLLNFNDFHGRIDEDSPDTVRFFGTIEEQRALAGKNNLLLSAGDSVGASLFASSVQQDKPTIDVLNAAGLAASAVGNHEFDRGFADLTGRIVPAAKWRYLGANVYRKGTTTPALPEYATFRRAGLRIAVIGAVTQETPSLVSSEGVATLDFGDPVDAVNRVARKLTDGKASNGEADVILAEYHEGAVAGSETSSLADQLALPGAFRKIVLNTSPRVAAIFTAHTHQSYAWDGPVPGHADQTRPVLSSGSYAELLGKVTLSLDQKTGEVLGYDSDNLPATETSDADLVAEFPRVATISRIVSAALAEAEEVGGEVIGQATAPITRASTSATEVKEDRASESTLSDLVADMYRDQLADPARGGAQIGIQNPGGTRADLSKGDVTLEDAASVLPFANSLFSEDLTGAQLRTVLEQQWQTNADGSPIVGGRPYLQLGLSDNVTYTFDASRPQGQRITSVTIDGKPLEQGATYRVATNSFLITGGDNFRGFTAGANLRDSGLIDLDSWVAYVKAHTPLSPSFAKRAVSVVPTPTAVTRGSTTTFTVSTLDFTSLGSPATRTLTASLNGSPVGSFAVSAGKATVAIEVPSTATAGAGKLVLTGDTGTIVTLPVTVT
jgi:5'-nucleotidase